MRTLSLTALITIALSLAGNAAAGTGDTILVKFRPGTSPAAQAAAHRRYGGTVVGDIGQLGVKVVRVAPGEAKQEARAYASEPSVSYAEVNASARAADTPNDPSFSLEWALTKIGAPQAWDVTHGSSAVTVAILDTGVSQSHPDLAGKIAANVNFSSSGSVDDLNGHGSHVAGIAAAATNNATGIAGLGYDTRILNVKVLGDDGSGLYSSIAQGITWAADNGARVINLSLGGTTASSTLESAVNYAWSKGALVVAAAGNNASSAPFYPAYYTNAVAVAATTDLDNLASFSDYGDWVDVAAPGISIYSTIPGGYGYMSGTSMAAPYVSGLAALLFARLTDTNGDGLVNDEVRAQIQGTADPIGVSGIGSGRIDAYQALTATVAAPPPVATTGTIDGTLTDVATGAALAGATVSDGAASAVTDAAGSYTIGNVAAGTYTVSATAAGYTGATQTASVTAGQTSVASFALTKVPLTGTVAGRVTDAATGAALAGAAVSVGSAGAVTDATGAYTVTGVPAGTVTVSVSSSGYTSASQSVSVTAGQTATANFGLAKAPAAVSSTLWASAISFKANARNLRVSVGVSSTAGPVAGVQVQLALSLAGGGSWTFAGTTDSTGTASFTLQKAQAGSYTATVTQLSGPYPWDPTKGVTSASYAMT